MSAARYVTLPSVEVLRGDDECYVRDETFGLRLEVDPITADAIELGRHGVTAAQLEERLGIASDGLAQWLEHYLLVPESDRSWMMPGLVHVPDQTVGTVCAIHRLHDHENSAAQPSFVVLGAPIDVAGEPGARLGPDIVRRAFRQRFRSSKDQHAEPTDDERKWGIRPPEPQPLLADYEMRRIYDLRTINVLDAGNVVWHRGEGLEPFGHRIEHIVGRVALAGHCPLVLGGDHALTFFALQPLLTRYEAVGILHFDAHHDMSAIASTIPPLTHATPFSHLLRSQSLRHLAQIGLRALESYDPGCMDDPRVSFVSARELRHLRPEEVFGDLPRDLPWYLSFDVDCLSPTLAPDTGAPELGGLDFYQALELIDYVARTFRIIGADFVEVAGRGGASHEAARTGAVVARLVTQFLLSHARFEPLVRYARAAAQPPNQPF